MKGLEELKRLRLDGLRPQSVFVNLVNAHDEWPALGCWGHLTVELLPSDSIAGIDFRPLVGLPVTVDDHTDGDPARLRRLAKAVSEIETSRLTMVARNGDAISIHIRAEGKTESYAA